MKKFSLIVCINNTLSIGDNNDLLYHIKSDLANFKSMTTDNVIICGRKTYESLPKRPLPNRTTIIITRDPNYIADEGVYVVHNIQEVIDLCSEKFSDKECFVIGGGQIYREFLQQDLVDIMYITRVLDDTEGETKFPCDPQHEQALWKTFLKMPLIEDNGIQYNFSIFKRKY
jgi:dihydrofolate reductase